MQFKPSAVTFFALFSWMLLSSVSGYAQSKQPVAPTTQNLATTVVPTPEVARPFSVAFGIAKTRSLNNFQDGTYQETTDLELIPSYRWKYAKTMLLMSYSQDTIRPENSDMNDMALVTSFKAWDFSRFKLSPTINVTIPESKVSRELRNLETAIGGKLTASIKPEFLIHGLSIYTGISVNRSFHRYETALNGAMNNQYSSRQGIGGGYEFGIYALSLDFGHVNAWTYQGNLKESYEHSEEASVSIGNHYGVSIGHTNGGSVFRANGYDSNYKLIDENNSMVYAKLSLQY